jgi:hypothetical protein
MRWSGVRGTCTKICGFTDHLCENRSGELLDVVDIDLEVAHKLKPWAVETLFHLRDCLFVPAAAAYCVGAVRAKVAAEGGIAGVMPLRIISTLMEAQENKSYSLPVITGFLCCRTPSSASTIYVNISNVRLFEHGAAYPCASRFESRTVSSTRQTDQRFETLETSARGSQRDVLMFMYCDVPRLVVPALRQRQTGFALSSLRSRFLNQPVATAQSNQQRQALRF